MTGIKPVQERIMEAARAVIAGRLTVSRKKGYCMMLARQVIEAGLGFADGGFYRRFVTLKVTPRHDGFWARDAQKSLQALGFEVRGDIMPGDIVFNDRVSLPYGHVGIYVGTVKLANGDVCKDVVLENTDAARGYRLGGAVALTKRAIFAPTAVFRIPEGKVR